MSDPTGRENVVKRKGMPLAERLVHLERDHARIVVALLTYGTLTALEEGWITVDTGYGVVLNWPVFLYLRERVKPRDRILEEALSHSVELSMISRRFGEQAVPPTCGEIKASLSPWWAKYLARPHLTGGTHSRKILLHADVPVERVLLDLETDHARALATLLTYGALMALEEGYVSLDVAERVVLNPRVLQYVRERIRPRDEALERGLSRAVELSAAGGARERQEVVRVCREFRTEIRAGSGPTVRGFEQRGQGRSE